MKKFLLLFSLLLSAGFTMAQVNIIYVEDFNNGMPPEYNIVDKDGKTPDPLSGWPANTAWMVDAGQALSFSWYAPVGQSDDWMITGAIDIPVSSNVDNKTLLYWYASSVLAQFRDSYEIYVSTTGNEPEDFTDKIFSIAAEVITGINRTADLSAYEGQTIYIAFRNNSNDKFVLIIDDIMIAETSSRDVSAVRSTTRSYLPAGNVNLSMEVQNLGSTPINSLMLHYSVNGGTVESATVSGLSISTLGRQNVSHPTPYLGTEGIHEVEFYITEVNGSDDADPTNNGVSATLSFYDPANSVQRRSLVEGYSSSSCLPCKAANDTFHVRYNKLAAELKPVTVKLQMPFPGVGDPYTTVETMSRGFDYYGVNAIPDSRIDGDFWDGHTIFITDSILIFAQNRPGLASLELEYTIDTTAKTVSITGTVIPSVDLIDGTRLMLAIKESSTTKNKKDNGESIFYNVLKKMVNGDGGIDLSGLTAGEQFDIDVTYTFAGNYRLPINGQPVNLINLATEHSVENFNNLVVSGWVEYTRDQYVLNAADATLGTVSMDSPVSLTGFNVFPNPAIHDAQIDIQLKDALECQVLMFDAQGKQVKQIFQGTLAEGETRLPISLNELPNGTYFVHLRSSIGVHVQTLNVIR